MVHIVNEGNVITVFNCRESMLSIVFLIMTGISRDESLKSFTVLATTSLMIGYFSMSY
jgi:hypothetical protein